MYVCALSFTTGCSLDSTLNSLTVNVANWLWQKHNYYYYGSVKRGPLATLPFPPVDKYGACLHATSRQQFEACFCFTFFRLDFLHRYSTFVLFVGLSGIIISCSSSLLLCFSIDFEWFVFFSIFYCRRNPIEVLEKRKKNQATLISIITKENNFAVHIVCTRH